MMQLDWRKSVQQPSFWFVALAGGLALLHLTLLDKSKLENLFSLSFLMWLTVASLLWDKRDRLVLESNLFSTCLGSTLLMFVLLRNLHSSDTSLRILPLVGGIGIMLIASGTKHLKDYYREIIILSLLVVARLVAVFYKVLISPSGQPNFLPLLFGRRVSKFIAKACLLNYPSAEWKSMEPALVWKVFS